MQKVVENDEVLYFNLIVSTNKNTISVEVKGPDFDSKEKMINWGLWLTYEEITNQPVQSKEYIKYYFDALVLIFKYYGLSDEKIRNIQKSVEEEVIGNKQYDYEEETLHLDFSDLDFE
ncbi:hypothetical protein [Sutcliffiella horikoshii]|uniref:hypothetical protein n=1 Tax=Sutcliffiella horikoshii TaxID=79883 RepID=UPI001F3B53AA|nr:hypothetical protein [Sutcliffiella horikoshii]MCG1021460.1 hypothetical protein [Sutcliffiella horikoshii]